MIRKKLSQFNQFLLTWKPIHLCWWFRKHGWKIPKYFIGTAIDIGNAATLRSANLNNGYIYIDKGNPANGTGILDTIEFYKDNTGVGGGGTVGTFYGSGTSYTTRDWGSMGSINPSGLTTVTGLSIAVSTDDVIGIEVDDLGPSNAASGGAGILYGAFGWNHSAHTYAEFSNRVMSLYGTGSTVVGPANLKEANQLSKESIKSINGLAIESVKSYNQLA